MKLDVLIVVKLWLNTDSFIYLQYLFFATFPIMGFGGLESLGLAFATQILPSGASLFPIGRTLKNGIFLGLRVLRLRF